VGTVSVCPSSTSLSGNVVLEEFLVKDTAIVPSSVFGPVARSKGIL